MLIKTVKGYEIMKKNNEFVNEDTYQTLKEFRVDPPSQDLAVKPLWKDRPKTLFYICCYSSA